MRANVSLILCSAWVAVACNSPGESIIISGSDGDATTGNAAVPATSTSVVTSASSGVTSQGPTSTTANPSSTTGGSDTLGEPPVIFDMGTPADVGDNPTGKVAIPENCVAADFADTTVGCLFYAVDLDQLDGTDNSQFAVVVSNVQTDQDATVVVETKEVGGWTQVQTVTVTPLALATLELPERHQEESGFMVGGSYRLSSDVPIVAYQFNPLTGEDASSDASMLLPVSSWSDIYQNVGWYPTQTLVGVHGTYTTIVAAFDGTQVEVIPSTQTLSGPGVPSGSPGVPFNILLNEGDVVEVMTKTVNTTLSGTSIISDPAHPIGVFSGGECSFVVAYSCDHIETQLSGVRLWGQEFVASRMPVRNLFVPETSMWQIYASEDDTTIQFTTSFLVDGVPVVPATLNRGEVLEFEVSGPFEQPGDFFVTADKPITVMNYMVGSSAGADGIGDPAMVQLPPTQQFLPRYVVLVPPTGWDTDVATITRAPGSEVLLDGVPVPDMNFYEVGPFEVGRVLVSDGVHTFDGDLPFGVVIAGYSAVDSYAYVGGIGTSTINPTPEG